jgi:hypothetical protein
VQPTLKFWHQSRPKICFADIIPAFEQAAAVRVFLEYDTLPNVAERAAQDPTIDVVVAPSQVMEKLLADGRLAGSPRTLGSVYISIVYRKGAMPAPVETMEQVAQTIRTAKTIGMSDSGTTAVFLTNVAKQLGLEEELTQKGSLDPSGPRRKSGAGGQSGNRHRTIE